METPANKVPANLEGSAVPDRSGKRPGKEEKSKRKDDKSVDQVMKGLNNLETTEEKLAAMCKKFAEVMDENRKLQLTAKQFEKGLNVIQREKEQLQTDHSKAVLTRSRLESLCRELQRQNKAVKEESLLKVREEEEKRKEVSAKFNATLGEITSLMSSSNEKTNKLRDENLDITKKFKSICEQNGLQQQQVDKMNMQRKLEAELSEAKLTKQKLEFTAEKEILLREKQQLLMDLQEARTRMCDMNTNESALKSQVALYSDRYEEFQNALTRSNEVFGGFKGEMDKMSKKIVKLEKETMSWKSRWEKSHQALLEMATDKQQRDAELALTQRQLAQLQKLCRTLQTERAGLLSQIKGSDKSADVAADEATVSSNGLDIDADVGGDDIMIDTPFVLNGLANVDEGSEVVAQPPVSIKEPELAVDPVEPKSAVHESKQNGKSGNKANKKAKPEAGAAQTTLLDHSSKAEKSKHSEHEAKTAKKIPPKNDKPAAAEKSAESKQKPIAQTETKPSDVPLVNEKPTNELPVEVPVATVAKPVEPVGVQTVQEPPAAGSIAAVVEQVVESPKVPVNSKSEIKLTKGGNQKVNKKSKPTESKPNDVVKSVVVEKVISTEEGKAFSSHTEAANATKTVINEKAKGKDSKEAEPEKVATNDQDVKIVPEKPKSILLAENIKSLETSVGKVDTSLKTEAVALEKTEAAEVEEIKPQDNIPKLEQPKVEKPMEIKEEVHTKTEKANEIKKVEQATPNITQKKHTEEEKPKAETAAPVSPKIATMADIVKSKPAAKVVDAVLKEAKKDEVAIVDKSKSEAQSVSEPSAEEPVKQEAASTDSKPSGSVSTPVAKPLTPVEHTINAILRVLEASIKQKQLPKEPAKEPTKGDTENSKEQAKDTSKLPAKETIKKAAKDSAKEPPGSPAKGPVKEDRSSKPSPVKVSTKLVAKEVANDVPKTPGKGTAREAPKVPAKETSKDAAKNPAAVSPKNAPKSPKNDKAPPKPLAKDPSKNPSKEGAKPAPPESAKVVDKEGLPAPIGVGDSKQNGKELNVLPGSTGAAVATAEAPVAPPASLVGAAEPKEPLVKAAEPVETPVVPATASTSTDKTPAPVQAEATETKKVKEGGKKRKK